MYDFWDSPESHFVIFVPVFEDYKAGRRRVCVEHEKLKENHNNDSSNSLLSEMEGLGYSLFARVYVVHTSHNTHTLKDG